MMEQIKGLSIQGKCFSEEMRLDFFPEEKDQVSIIYGKNGSGKTTISNGIYELAQGLTPEGLFVFLYDQNDCPFPFPSGRVFVFNERYIDRNLRVEKDGLDTILFLGEQVNMKKEMEQCAERQRLAQIEVEKAEAALDELKGDFSPESHYQAIVQTLKGGGWAARDRDIKGNKAKSQVSGKVIQRICENASTSPAETIDQLEKQFSEKMELLAKVSANRGNYPRPIPLVPYEGKFEEELLEQLRKVINQPILTEREQQILSVIEKYGLPFVDRARMTFNRGMTRICPYCFQNVSGEYKQGLLNSINCVLNKEAETHRNKLQQLGADLQSLSEALRLDFLTAYSDLDLFLTRQVISLAEQCRKRIIPQYQTALVKKGENVYTPVEILPFQLREKIDQVNMLLARLESKRREFNEAANQVSRLKKELTSLNDKIAHLQTALEYSVYQKQKWKQVEFERALHTRRQKLAQVTDELEKLNQRRSRARPASVMMNQELAYVLWNEGRLFVELATDPDGTHEKYILKSNQKNVKPESLSAGERNMLALCYFFAEILANQEESDFYKNEALIIIDDPVSNFDFENRARILSLLRYQIGKLIQGNQSSRIVILSHDVATVSELAETLQKSNISPQADSHSVRCACYAGELVEAHRHLIPIRRF